MATRVQTYPGPTSAAVGAMTGDLSGAAKEGFHPSTITWTGTELLVVWASDETAAGNTIPIRAVLGIAAAIAFAVAGYQMVSLHSQAGNSIAELFDQAVGILSFGLALLSVAIAAPSTRG